MANASGDNEHQEVILSQVRETTRGVLARGLLWILALTIGGILFFVGAGLMDGTVITQSVFPSLIALAGTALGFYFGAKSSEENSGGSENTPPTGSTTGVIEGRATTTRPPEVINE